MKHCNATTNAGRPCGAYHIKNLEQCYMHAHTPLVRSGEARQRGGLVTKQDRLDRRTLQYDRLEYKLLKRLQNGR
jgi:hypothetical protein